MSTYLSRVEEKISVLQLTQQDILIFVRLKSFLLLVECKYSVMNRGALGLWLRNKFTSTFLSRVEEKMSVLQLTQQDTLLCVKLKSFLLAVESVSILL